MIRRGAALLCFLVIAAAAAADVKPAGAVVHLHSGTVLKKVRIEGSVTVQTRYGVLTVPWTDVRHVVFGLRIPEAEAARVRQALVDLDADNFEKREAAARDLLALGRFAYPGLLKMGDGANLEVVRRVEALIAEIKRTVPEDQLQTTEDDVIQAGEQVLAGRIDAKTLVVHADVLGKLQLPLAELKTLKSADLPDDAVVAKDAVPAQAHVNGKYAKLLRKIHVPNDRASYGDFTDYGAYNGNSYGGFNDLPSGYWVYVQPYWYIWQDMK